MLAHDNHSHASNVRTIGMMTIKMNDTYKAHGAQNYKEAANMYALKANFKHSTI